MTLQASNTNCAAAISLDGNRGCWIDHFRISGEDEDADTGETHRWDFGLKIDDANVANTPSGWLTVSDFDVQAIGSTAGDSGIYIKVKAQGWGFNFSRGIVQCEENLALTNYTTVGDIGLSVLSGDGLHFAQIEFIDFDRPAFINSATGYTFITNFKFDSVSMEVPGATQFALTMGGGTVSSGSFLNCTMFGTTGIGGLGVETTGTGNIIRGLKYSNCYFSANGADYAVSLKNTGLSLTTGASPNMRSWEFNSCNYEGADFCFLIDDDWADVQIRGGECNGNNVAGDIGIDINGSDDKTIIISDVRFIRIPTAGDQIDTAGYTGSWANFLVSDCNPPHPLEHISCRIRATSDQTGVVTATRTKVVFDTIDHESHSGMADLVNERIIIPRDGKYLITAMLNGGVSPLPATSRYRLIWIEVNGSTDIAVNAVEPVSNGGIGTIMAVSTTYELSEDDFVELDGQHNKGSNETWNASAEYAPVLTADYVGPLD